MDYEDLEISSQVSQTSATAHSRITWSQRLLITSRVLTILHIVLNLRLIVFAWALYAAVGRFFIMLPFALEATLSLVFEAVGSQAFWMGRRTTFKRCTGCKFSACLFYVIQTVWTIIVLVLTSKVLRALTFEPAPLNVVNADWQWLWSAFGAYAAFSALNIIASLGLAVVIVIHWWLTSKTIPEYEGLRPKRGLVARVSYFITMFAYFMLCCAALVMLGMALASTANLSGKFGRPDARSYDGCDPIDPTACLYPFPSSHFLRTDPTTETQYRVAFGPKSLMKTMDGGRISPTLWNELDGFSTIAPLLFYLPGAVNNTFIPHTDIGRYLEPDASTIILNVVSGQRVAHWTELDMVDSSEPSIVMQPAVPLEHSTRYMAVVRHLRDSSGQLIHRSPAFASLMGGDPNAAHDIKRYDQYHNELIPAMQAAGINIDEVQLAWDFVTVSSATNHGRYEAMRTTAMAYNPLVEVVREEQGNCDVSGTQIGRSITAKLTVPNFLTQKWKRGGFLPRSSPGVRGPIVQSGESSTYVLIRVPCSLTEREHPQAAVQVVQYGHGLFGSRQEVTSGWIGEWLNSEKMVFFASDWFGMSKFDKLKVMRIILSDLSHFATIPESTLQGWANKVVVYKSMLSGQLRQFLQNSGISLVPHHSNIPYYGISQGGVVGGGYVASSPYISRATLGVPGSPFALLLSRSHDFDAFHYLFTFSLYGWRDIRIALGLMQQLWDQGESAGWLSYMQQHPSSVPNKTVLIQDAHGDAQVTILGAQLMARAFQAKNVVPAIQPIWGVPPIQESQTTRDMDHFNFSNSNSLHGLKSSGSPFVNRNTTTGSAITEWRYDNVPAMPFENIAPLQEFDTHECIRREPESQSQIFNFFTTGVIGQTCQDPSGCKKAECKWLEERRRAKHKKNGHTALFEAAGDYAASWMPNSVSNFLRDDNQAPDS